MRLHPTLFLLVTLLGLSFFCACKGKKDSVSEQVATNMDSTKNNVSAPTLDITQANRLAKLPLACLEKEYPNKLNQVLSDSTDLLPPSILHPAFYGCFDWHSSVHGHWSLVALLKAFPDLENATLIQEKLKARISKENIQKELLYFDKDKNFERMYGWAWLLKLAEELHTWDNPLGKELEQNLQPLTDFIIQSYISFLPKLHYPIRIGTHTNTGFGLAFAYDYAITVGHQALQEAIATRAKHFFEKDQNGPITWEPDGYDFLSPCLEEIDIMRRVLSKTEFATWLKQFLPQLSDPSFKLEPGIVSDRTDGHLVHLDGVNFSRAWCLYGIAQTLPEYQHLNTLAHLHINYSLPAITDGNYEGGHWLASFAIYALISSK